MNQNQIITLAKQGNIKAIAALINHTLQTKKINVVKISIKENCLQIMLEGEQVPPQQHLVNWLTQFLMKLNISLIKTVKIYGKEKDDEFPAWHQEVNLEITKKPSLEQLAQQADIKAINVLINQWLELQNIKAKVQIKVNFLQIKLIAETIPEQNQIVSLLRNNLIKLNISLVKIVKIYAQQVEDDFPVWHQEFNLEVSNQSTEIDQHLSSNVNKYTEILESNQESLSIVNNNSEIDVTKLSIAVYDQLHREFFKPLSKRFNDEEEAENVYAIVKAFNIDYLDNDLKSNLTKIIPVMAKIIPNLNSDIIEKSFNKIASSNFTNINLAVKKLSKVTDEVLAYNFPEGNDGLTDAFKNMLQGFSSEIGIKGVASQETAIGAAIGTLIAPGLGTLVGSAIGGWMAGNKRQQEIQNLLSKYQEAKEKVIEEVNKIWQVVYNEICSVVLNNINIELQSYEQFQEQFNQYQQHYQEAWKYCEEENYDLCIVEIETANNIFPKKQHPDLVALGNLQDDEITLIKTQIFIADAYLGAKNLAKATLYYNKVLEKVPENHYSSYRLACISAYENKDDEAINYLEKAISNGFCDLEMLERDLYFNNMREQNNYLDILNKLLSNVSESKVDFSKLNNLLKNQDWKKADYETWNIFCRIVGKPEKTCIEAKELQKISYSDFHIIDWLWRKYSQEKFGFTIQFQIFQDVNNDEDDFREKVDWFEAFSQELYGKKEFNLSLSKGYLPYICYQKGKWMFMDDSEILSDIMSLIAGYFSQE